MRNVCILVAAFIASVAASAPAGAQDLTDPYTIFAQARRVWTMQRYPRSVSYVVVMRGTYKGADTVRHYETNFDSYSGAIYPDAVSQEEREHPFVPHGTNINISVAGIPIPLNPEHADRDPFGVPQLAPNYSFGIAPVARKFAKIGDRELIAQIRAEYPAQQKPVGTTGIPEIGSVTARHRDYVIELLGVESLRSTFAYHLRLRAVRAPKYYRLRELWIDAKTFAVERLTSDGNFDHGAATRARWTVDYTTLDGLQYIDTERAAGTLRYADDPLRISGHTVENQTISFTALRGSERGFVQSPLIDSDVELVREPD